MGTKAGERRLRVGDRLVENDRRWQKIQFARPGCGRGFGAGVRRLTACGAPGDDGGIEHVYVVTSLVVGVYV